MRLWERLQQAGSSLKVGERGGRVRGLLHQQQPEGLFIKIGITLYSLWRPSGRVGPAFRQLILGKETEIKTQQWDFSFLRF